jgi:fatty-acyl-CoA synthase
MRNESEPSSIYDLMTMTCATHAEKTAITYIEEITPTIIDTRMSYQSLLEMMNQAARLIHRELDGRRGVVSFLLPNIPQAQAILWGGSAVAVINPLNPLLDEDTLLSLLDSAGTEILFALGPQEQSGIWEKAVALAPRAKKLKKIYSVHNNADKSSHSHFDTEMAQESKTPLPDYWLPEANGNATYFHTGGTTGVPKLAVHSHRNHVITALSRNRYSGLEAGEAMINGLPLFHIGGSTLNSLGMFAGGMNVILPTIDGYRNKAIISKFWRLVEHYRIASNACVPTSMAAILQVPLADADISSLRISASGGSVVPDVISDGVMRVTGHPLYQIYAMTETTGLTALPAPHVEPVKGCAGWVPPEVEIRIGGGGQAPGEAGEIYIRSQAVFKGYLSHDESAIDAQGWLASGDLGYLDEQGRLYITGRSKDLIIRGGHNIDPLAIEACLEKHPAVVLAAAVGKPDSYAGELPIAFVQLVEGQSASPEELVAFAQDNISERPACPKQIFVLDALPVTAVGKIHKPSLREKAAELVVREALTEKFPSTPFEVTAKIGKGGQMLVSVVAAESSAEVQALLEQLAAELKLVFTELATCRDMMD